MEVQERQILTVTCFGHFLSHYNVLVFPTLVLPLSHRLGLDLASVLGLSFWQYLLFGISALPWGLASDRFGAKLFLQIFFLGTGLSSICAALLIDSPTGLAVSLGGLGLFSGIYHPAGLGLISKGVKRLSMGMAYNGMIGNVGMAISPLLTGFINWIHGPAAVFFALAAFNLVGLVMMSILRFEEPEGASTSEAREGASVLTPFLVLLAAMMLGGLAYRGANVILPAYFELKGQGFYQSVSAIGGSGITANFVAAALTSLIFAIGIIGQYAGGWAADRFEIRRSFLFFHLLSLPAVFLMSLFTNLPLVLFAVMYFFFLLGMQPIENTLVARLTPPRLHHSAYGLKFMLTFGVGSLAVKMVGYIEKTWGLDMVYPSVGMVSVGLVICILILIGLTKPMRTVKS